MKKIKKLLSLIGLCTVFIIVPVGCEKSSSETEPTSAVDVLSDDEKRAYEAVIDLSSNFKNDSSIKVRSWYKILDSEKSNALGGFEISGENSMGGAATSLYMYNTDTDELEKIDEDDDTYAVVAFTLTNEEYFEEQDQEVIDKLNRAIVEYFDNRGY